MKINLSEDAIRETSWETLTVEDVMSKLSVTQEGLTKQEAKERLEAFGQNKLPVEKQAGFIKKFLLQFNNALIYVLLAAAVLTAFLQHWVDTWVIIAVVVINAIIGYIQEDKAEKALENIKHMLSLKASIIRDGKREEISAEDLVIGDLVLLKAGDKIPADLRLIETSNFQVEEASLTGESEAVSKKIEPVAPETVLGERLSMAYTGTTVRAGSGKGIVIATASDTELGKINTMLSETHATTTPLIRKINGFGKVLSLFIVLFSVLIFLYGIIVQGLTAGETSLAVIGLAVAAIPEGLPAILTITLAIGVQRMAKRNAIIRRLPSVETLGSVTVICSDKTGTLTRNEMTATNIYTRGGEYQVEGAGYEPIGNILKNSEAQDVSKNIVLLRLLQSSYLCNDSELRQNKDGLWDVQGIHKQNVRNAFPLNSRPEIGRAHV